MMLRLDRGLANVRCLYRMFPAKATSKEASFSGVFAFISQNF